MRPALYAGSNSIAWEGEYLPIRWPIHLVILGAVAFAANPAGAISERADDARWDAARERWVNTSSAWWDCEQYHITGYTRDCCSDRTADGTSIWTDEPIAAGSYNLPLGSWVNVDGLGSYRIADRGLLYRRHIDIPVDTVDQARALTSEREVCRID